MKIGLPPRRMSPDESVIVALKENAATFSTQVVGEAVGASGYGVCLPVQVSALFGLFRAQEVAEEAGTN